MMTTPVQTPDPRPSAAIGHVSLFTSDASAAATRLERVGVRVVVSHPGFAILELRGGTHIVVREEADLREPRAAGFDLMFDSADAAAERFRAAGFDVGPISRGSIHHSFRAVAPEGFALSVTSTHAGDRAV